MRVIAGIHRGRRLKAPPGRDVRPTADRVKEALFSILGDLHEQRVLDLFAGTGALGIEALSRGAASAVFVDSDVRPVTANLEGIEGGEVLRADVRAALRSLQTEGRQYDLVLLDPPYRHAQADLAVAGVLAPDGLAVSESDRRSPIDLPDLHVTDERRYGDTLIRFHAH